MLIARKRIGVLKKLTQDEFKPFPKIPRWSKTQHIFITEKIDGTNAQIVINEGCTELRCGCRTRWIDPDNDNYGFARWVYDNKENILKLGKGQHFGEWWGAGIQRGYGLADKKFSLFNVLRWDNDEQKDRIAQIPGVEVVPVLYKGPFSDTVIDDCLKKLYDEGSVAAPGYKNPEGVVIYMPASKTLYKKTFNEHHKWELSDDNASS
jgi:RNA ligase-like protein